MKLWKKVGIGLVSGIVLGLIIKEQANHIKFIGDIFIHLLKMIVVPLVFFSLVSGITNVSDSSTLGRIGVKSCIAFISTTAFAIIIGITTATILEPGKGVVINFSNNANSSSVKTIDFMELITDIVPGNAIAAMANGNMLQVVFFAIFTGLTLNSMGNEGKKIVGYVNLFTKMVFKMIGIIVSFSPYGAFALAAWVVGTQGIEVLQSLAKLLVSVAVAMSAQYIIFGLFILVVARVSPIPFYKKSFEYQLLAFSTSSSKATLATTMRICKEKLGVSESSTSFILPLGASINMDGMAIYLGMCAIFFAQVTGTVLQPHEYAVIIFTATIGSIGAAGVPSGSIVMLPVILSSVGLPIEGVALIAGIDRILDMLRTTINITGDATVTLLIDSTEGTFDKKIYYSDNDNNSDL